MLKLTNRLVAELPLSSMFLFNESFRYNESFGLAKRVLSRCFVQIVMHLTERGHCMLAREQLCTFRGAQKKNINNKKRSKRKVNSKISHRDGGGWINRFKGRCVRLIRTGAAPVAYSGEEEAYCSLLRWFDRSRRARWCIAKLEDTRAGRRCSSSLSH